MLFIFIIVFILLLFLCFTITYWPYLSTNLYIATAIYGVMGTGKTTLAQKIIYKYAVKGWKIFSNYKMSYSSLFDPRELGYVRFPENSLIVVDECATYFPARNWKKTDPNLLKWIKDLRKNKNAILFISQNTDFDKLLRDSCKKIYVMKKIWLFSIGKAVLSIMDITNNSGDSENSNGGDIIFKFKYTPFTLWEFTFIPRWSGNYFNSFERITDLPLIEGYSVDEKELEALSPKMYRKYKRKFWSERWKSIFKGISNLPYKYIKKKKKPVKMAENGSELIIEDKEEEIEEWEI